MSTEEKESPGTETPRLTEEPEPKKEPETEPGTEPEKQVEKEKPVPSRSVGVVLSDGKVIEFDPKGMDLSVGDSVVVDNDRDLNLGKVAFLGNNRTRKPLRRVIRRVGPEDLLLIRRNKKREEEAFVICSKRIEERKLPMKLIQVAYLHGGNKAIFYFSADGRVDFRALVRDLAQQLHVRIEMRQIGVRDESKMLGGLGICGQQLCCSRFLRKFVPVSIKMAKNQNLALNPQKLSGLCGRLMCCLVYEDELYRKLRKDLPKVGSTVESPRGPGKVLNVDILGRRIQLQLEQGTVDMTIEELRGEVPLQPARDPKPQAPEPPSQPQKQKDQEKPREAKRRRKRRPKSRQSRAAAGDASRSKAASPAGSKPGHKPGAADRKDASPDPAAKKKRKRRSRRRSRRRKKKAPGEGGSAGDRSGGGSGPAGGS